MYIVSSNYAWWNKIYIFITFKKILELSNYINHFFLFSETVIFIFLIMHLFCKKIKLPIHLWCFCKQCVKASLTHFIFNQDGQCILSNYTFFNNNHHTKIDQIKSKIIMVICFGYFRLFQNLIHFNKLKLTEKLMLQKTY